MCQRVRYRLWHTLSGSLALVARLVGSLMPLLRVVRVFNTVEELSIPHTAMNLRAIFLFGGDVVMTSPNICRAGSTLLPRAGVIDLFREGPDFFASRSGAVLLADARAAFGTGIARFVA
jgi:hypothetical protein